MIQQLEVEGKKLGVSSNELTHAANDMHQNSHKTKEELALTAKVGADVLSAVNLMSASTEELVASISEISRSTSEASTMTKNTMNLATEVNNKISDLGKKFKRHW